MAGIYSVIQQAEQMEEITRKNNPAFLHYLQRALLLALQEQGTLRIAEYRRAEENLFRQYHSGTGGAAQ